MTSGLLQGHVRIAVHSLAVLGSALLDDALLRVTGLRRALVDGTIGTVVLRGEVVHAHVLDAHGEHVHAVPIAVRVVLAVSVVELLVIPDGRQTRRGGSVRSRSLTGSLARSNGTKRRSVTLQGRLNGGESCTSLVGGDMGVSRELTAVTLDSGRDTIGESTNACVVVVKVVIGMRIRIGGGSHGSAGDTLDGRDLTCRERGLQLRRGRQHRAGRGRHGGSSCRIRCNVSVLTHVERVAERSRSDRASVS